MSETLLIHQGSCVAKPEMTPVRVLEDAWDELADKVSGFSLEDLTIEVEEREEKTIYHYEIRATLIE